MDELFRKFCYYYITKDNTISLDELKKESKENFKKYQKKAQKYVKNLQKKVQKLGYNLDFESFCNLLEEYINKKDNLNDSAKKEYLKILVSLSKIHDVNLREELERYTSYKQKKTPINEKEIFKTFCLYNLTTSSKAKDFNKLKELSLENNFNFHDVYEKSLIFTEEIKQLTEKLGFTTQKEDLYKMIDTYNQNKHSMNDKEKSIYLKILLYLSEIYNINLRSLLMQTNNKEKSLNETNYNNPLDNDNLLSTMLTSRYQEGSFNLNNLILKEDKIIKEKKNIDYEELQANLIFNLYNIFLDKFNNYAYDDLNPSFTSLINEEDISILTAIKEEDIYHILKEINNRENPHYIIKKYKITNNLYQFISLTITDAVNLKENHLGLGNKSLFNNNNSVSEYSIYINGPEYETILFLNEYIRKCILNNLNYDLLGLSNEKYTIIYASKEDLKTKLDIINKIASSHQEWIDSFGLPMPMSSINNNTFYGLSEIGLYNEEKDDYIPYIDYINSLAEVAYYRTLAKLVISKIPEEKAINILNNFIMLNNITFNNTKNPIEAKYNGISFSTIKDLINQYIPTISSSLNIYMNDNKQKTILIKEFRKSLQYLSNIIAGKEKKDNSNIAFNLIS